MGYILNEDQKSLVAMAHDFCEKEIKPYAAQWDRDGVFPLESYKKAMEIGYHCLEIPEEYGGGGIDYVTVAAVMEEFAKYDLGFATTLMGTTLSPVSYTHLMASATQPMLLVHSTAMVALPQGLVERSW